MSDNSAIVQLCCFCVTECCMLIPREVRPLAIALSTLVAITLLVVGILGAKSVLSMSGDAYAYVILVGTILLAINIIGVVTHCEDKN